MHGGKGQAAYGALERFSFGDLALADERAAFISKTYLHLAGAVLAFAALCTIFLQMGVAEQLFTKVANFRWGFAIFMGAFMLVSIVAENATRRAISKPAQYCGLGVYVVAEALVFCPLLFIADRFFPGKNILPTAATITGALFAGLTVIVHLTRKDFSFMRGILFFGGFALFAIAIVAAIMGFNLPVLFTCAAIALMCGYILYDTSNVIHHYLPSQYIIASLGLFAAFAGLLWHVIVLLMKLQDD